MAQTFTDNCFIAAGVAQTDMQNIETNFAAIKSSFSGTSSPSDVVGGMLWHDSTARKVRNYANTGWLISLLGDASQKMWVYRNDTCEGWLIDSSVTDRVIALKGGSNAYNVNGGVTGGTWTQPNHTHAAGSILTAAHVHQVYEDNAGSSNAQTYDSSGVIQSMPAALNQGTEVRIVRASGTTAIGIGDLYTKAYPATATTGTSGNGATASTYRPAAAVGTLQYPDTT